MRKTSAGLGAAAFAIGMSLAGPHPVAVADGAAGDGRPAAGEDQVQESDSPPSQPVRRAAAAPAVGGAAGPARVGAGRSRATAGPEVVRGRRGDVAVEAPLAEARSALRDSITQAPAHDRPTGPASPSAATAGEVAPTPILESPPAAPVPRAASAVPTGATPVAAPDPAPDPAPPLATAAAQRCPNCWVLGDQAGVPVRQQTVNAVVRAARFIDGVANWLSGLPANPVNEFLSGALLLLRRNLFPTVPTVPAVSVGDAQVDENNPRVVFTVTLDRAYESTVTVGYTTTGALSNPGVETAELDARATAGADYQAASGFLTFAPGQTARDVSVTLIDDPVGEVSETFSLQIVATWAPRAASAAAVGAAATPPNQLTGVVLASATATIVDDDRVAVAVNPNFAYGDVLLASVFSELAYKHRQDGAFTGLVQNTGWQGIGISGPALGPDGYSPTAGGYGVKAGLSMQSYAFAGRRTAGDGTEQFVVAFEGSNVPPDDWLPADWIANAAEYGWSRYYASVQPLMAEVVGQLIEAQQNQKKTQFIITGHSLGGAAAMMAFADLLAPQGNLWPDTAAVLAAGGRVLDSVGGWSPEIRTALLAATSVYTFGAPSILIEPTKPGTAQATAFAAVAAGSGLLAALGLLPAAIGALTVDDKKLPDLSGIAGINFGTRVFQFEHANTSWVPPYPGDIVAQIGSRDPGRVLAVNLDNTVHRDYTGLLQFVPGATHFMDRYKESVIRLVTNARLLKSPNKLIGDSPQLPRTAAGKGGDTTNDFFVNLSDDGKAGNDLFVFSQPGSYAANGGAGSDAYTISGYDISLTIDGAAQSGRDTVVFDLTGTPGAKYLSTGAGPLNDTAVFSVTGADGKSSSVTVTGWDRWQVSDVLQVIKPADGRWTLDVWTDIERGPMIAASPAGEVPLSVL
ncbi:MAG: hypothetical protein FGM52_08840 [Mycobacterium sp.]|nr:hypothetical protein [Mycobacterium sp.]